MTTTTEIDTARLTDALEWATDQWRRAERGEPSEWNQGSWFATRLTDYQWRCGTPCCLAGKVAMEEGWLPCRDEPEAMVRPDGRGGVDTRDVQDAADAALNLDEGGGLYSGCNLIGDLWAIAHDLTGGAIELPADFATMPRWRDFTPPTP